MHVIHQLNYLHQMVLFEHWAHLLCWDSGPPSQPVHHTIFSQPPQVSTMDADSKLQKRALLLLNAAIKAVNIMKDVSGIMPATPVFSTVIILLTLIRVCFLFFSNGLFRLHVQPGLYGQ